MIVTILAFLFILAFSITIHEFGHFLIAKLFKIPVEKFSIGYGPPLIRKQIGETDFRIAYFPLGGYVKIAGEEEGEITQKAQSTENTEGNIQKKEGTEYTEEKAQKTQNSGGVATFYEAPIYQRVLIVLAGPLFNIFSAFFVFIIILAGFGILVNPYMKITVDEGSAAEAAGLVDSDSIVMVAGRSIADWDAMFDVLSEYDSQRVSIGVVRAGEYLERELTVDINNIGLQPLVPPILGSLKLDGPAQKAGMQQGDRILKIGDSEIESWNQMVDTVRNSVDIPLRFSWLHEGEAKSATITPTAFYDPISEDTIGQVGAIMPLQRRHIPVIDVVSMSAERSVEVIWLTLKTLYQLIIGRISRRAIGGPIAIARLSGESARWGFENLLGLLAIISINLGLINLFPIPVLDGGHVVISVIEAARRKRFSKRTRIIIQQIGYAIILLLIVFVTFNDITR
ncbi:MAG: RIP metalloprotease RseP [candidate division WOR-3 bacterium]|jgi:regulator of sigma E protease